MPAREGILMTDLLQTLDLPSAPLVAARIAQQIAKEVVARVTQVTAAVALLDEGATVPFIARYRKEATDGLDDTQLRNLQERLVYLREMEERRSAVLSSIFEQTKLTKELRKQIDDADTKQRIEDLYLPFKPKRRTKAQIAREAGLQALADQLLADPSLDPQTVAQGFVSVENGVADAKAALEGARDILTEQFAEDADLVANVRDYMWRHGVLWSKVVDGKQQEGAKFQDYFDYNETIHTVPSHRSLAVFRGRNEQVLTARLGLSEAAEQEAELSKRHPCEFMIAKRFNVQTGTRPGDLWINSVVRWTWRVKLQLQAEMELFSQLRQAAEAEAIKVFGSNLRDLLLAAPAGAKVVMGIDPGIRTGCKLAVVDHTGKL
jgi:protein Tex